MTEADKKQIETLLATAKEMKGIAERQVTPYHDEKVAEFASKAVGEYREVRDYLVGMIGKNKEVFLDFNNLRIDNGGLGMSFFEIYPVVARFGKYLHVSFHLDKSGIKRSWSGNAGGLYAEVDPGSVMILDVWLASSDTKDPNYDTISHWALAGGGGRQAYDLSGCHDAQTWQEIYNYATWTRAKCKLLWKSGIDAVRERGEFYRANANKTEQTHESLSAVGVYIRVSGV